MRLPKPRQCGHAPNGVLNENRIGRGSSKVRPHVVQQLAAQTNGAGVGRFETSDEVEQRRFPTSAGAK